MTRPSTPTVPGPVTPTAPDPLVGPWPDRARDALAVLPDGAVAQGRASMLRGLTRIGLSDDRDGWASDAAIARQLVRPLLQVEDWPGPSQPLAVGHGAVHADLIDSDHEVLARLRALLAASCPLDPETLAAEAQNWRLPVTPYRQLSGLPPDQRPLDRQRPGSDPRDARIVEESGPWAPGSPWARQPVVVDLSTLWAGPLATSLLADLGARVVKIDPDCRPDGFREHPTLYRSLNQAKEIVDLDLRQPDDRRSFEALVRRADLVVSSFSRRVMPNFGYGPDQLRALNPTLATLSIVAYPAGSAEQDWVAYGPGVHATSGLAASSVQAETGGPIRYQATPIAYPDALAGLAAFAAAAELVSHSHGQPGSLRPTGAPTEQHRELSLAGVLGPLVARALERRDRRP